MVGTLLRDQSYVSVPLRYCTEGGPYKSHAQNHGQPEVTCEYNAGRSPAGERPAIELGRDRMRYAITKRSSSAASSGGTRASIRVPSGPCSVRVTSPAACALATRSPRLLGPLTRSRRSRSG